MEVEQQQEQPQPQPQEEEKDGTEEKQEQKEGEVPLSGVLESVSPAPLPVPAPPTFDLETYIGRYGGQTKLMRLLFIAERCPDLTAEACRAALEDIKGGMNTSAYGLLQKYLQHLPSDSLPATGWVEQQNRRASSIHDRLEQELSSYKTNLIKESIRMGFNELGDFHYKRGSLNEALKCYVRTRDYCTTNRHSAEMCLNVIKVSIDLGSWQHVNSYVAKAEHTADISDPIVLAKLKAVAGLFQLQQSDYFRAASCFIEVKPELGAGFSQVMAPEDVAIYGGLCALASFSRQELKRDVLENACFKHFLDLVPRVRELISDLYHSKYKSFLEYLDVLKAELRLDLHLHKHIERLCEKIRDNCLVQYFSPYISVRLQSMADAFGSTVGEIEKQVEALIVRNVIAARIDSRSATLHTKQAEQRNVSYSKVLRLGETFQNELQAILLRMSCIENDLVVRGRPGGATDHDPLSMEGGHHHHHKELL